MKSIISRVISLITMIALIGISVLAVPVKADAAEGTFSGTVSDKTTSDILYLITSGGTMEIKIDSNTDLSSAKFLLPGYKVTCNCYTAADEYWHASKITGSAVAGAVSVDTSKQATVNGTVAKGTNEQTLFLKMNDGTMELKIDPTTDVSGVRMFIMGKSLQVVCARGSDAYMHALSIRDYQTSAVSGADSGNNNSVATVSSAYSVSGTVDKNTTASVLYLSTSGGLMQLKIDSGATAGCRAMIPGQKVTAGYYRGSDEWLHTSQVINNTSKQAATTTLDPNSLTVSGSVGGDTSESTLYLVTSGGTMQIRMDAGTDFSGCPVLIKGKNVQVICRRGADEYYHAVAIANK